MSDATATAAAAAKKAKRADAAPPDSEKNDSDSDSSSSDSSQREDSDADEDSDFVDNEDAMLNRMQEQRKKMESICNKEREPIDLFTYRNTMKEKPKRPLVVSSSESESSSESSDELSVGCKRRSAKDRKDSDIKLMDGRDWEMSNRRKTRRKRKLQEIEPEAADPLLENVDYESKIEKDRFLVQKMVHIDPELRPALHLLHTSKKTLNTFDAGPAEESPPPSPPHSPTGIAPLPERMNPSTKSSGETVQFKIKFEDGKIANCLVKQKDTFRVLLERLQKKSGRSIWLCLDDAVVPSYATTISAGISENTVLSAVYQKPSKTLKLSRPVEAVHHRENAYPSSKDCVQLRFLFGDSNKPIIALVRKGEKFGSIAEHLAKRRNAKTIMLWFDGEKVDSNLTPAELDLENDDQLDAKIVS